MPRVLEKLAQTDLTRFAQFTIDWADQMQDLYDAETPDTGHFNNTVRYEITNILAIMDPTLPDVAFFRELLELVA